MKKGCYPHLSVTKMMVLCAILPFSVAAQQPGWLWAESVGNFSALTEGWSCAADYNGDVYVTGSFEGPTLTIGGTTLANNGFVDAYIAKYSSQGVALWVKSWGGNGEDEGYSVATDKNNNVIVTGFFESDSMTIGNYTLYNHCYASVFVIKYDANGNLLWARSSNGSGIGNDRANGIATDMHGSILITGQFTDNSIVFTNDTLWNQGNGSVFIIKYDVNGNVIWAHSAAGGRAWGIATDTKDNVCITGDFGSNTLTFESDSVLLNAMQMSSDVFLAKYDSSGNLLWARREGGNSFDGSYAIATDGSNIFITGYYSGTTAIGGDTLMDTGFGDMFLAKYDSSGNWLWTKSGGGNQGDNGYSLSTDQDGSVYVSGAFAWYSTDTIVFDSTVLTALPGDPMFLLKYDANGNLMCATALSSGGDDYNGVCVDHLGNAFIAGDYFYGPFVIGNDTLPLLGEENLFVAKFNCGNEHVGIDDLHNEGALRIFPNPTSSKARINFDCRGTKEASLIISNSIGKNVESILLDCNAGFTDIDLTDFGPGFYFIRLESGGLIFEATKLILVR